MRGSGSCQHGKYATCQACGDVGLRAVSAVTHRHFRLLARPSAPAVNLRHRIDQVDRRFRIIDVGWAGSHHQRCAVAIGQDMAFAAVFRTVRRVGAGVPPPKTARTLAESMATSEASSLPRRPRIESSFSCTRGQTPASVQSRSRRQHVTPLPQPSSAGMNRQGMPVRSTYTMPVKHARRSTGGRPPLGLGTSAGNRGSISFQSLSGTNVNAMASPPCLTWHSFHRQNYEF